MKLSDAFLAAGLVLIVLAALLFNVVLGVLAAGMACAATGVMLERSGTDGDS